MFCPKCGAENRDDSKFCVSCGTNFSLSDQDSSNSTSRSSLTVQKAKNPVIAVVLNFFILWGLGYWYLDIKTIYGYPWYFLIALEFILFFLTLYSGIFTLVLFACNISLAYDVYKKGVGEPGFVPLERM
ncbi:zinc-ribbon domain-containing protein [Methanococcoides burtonii]|uniref:zinc-ribbon domain-containing protein n=1 Tax=Methanococcoides burtonii TaxID=29291 RepID=UPI0000541A29|nr:zinc ribbon domain-containing protein [Methanococcoides burtonii]